MEKDLRLFRVKGHVRFTVKEIGIDVENDFLPNYEILPEKRTLISDIKKMVNQAETVWLATDDDREGEAISWHLIEAAKIPDDKTKRIVFHEITKTAIENAFHSARKVDVNLVIMQASVF